MSSSVSRPAKATWAAVPVIVGAGIVASLQVGKAAILAPLLQADLHLDLASVGWLTAVFAILGALGGIPVGAIVASIGDRRILLLGLGATALGAALGAIASSYSILLVSRVIEGLGFLLITVSGPALLQRAVSAERRNFAFALWSCFMPTGIALAMLTAPLFAGWRTYWWWSGALAIVALLCVALFVPSLDTRSRLSWRGLASDAIATVRADGPRLLSASFALYSLMFFALFSFLPVLLVDRMGVSLRTAGLLSAVATSANILGNLAAGALLTRGINRSTLVGAASVIMGLTSVSVFLSVLPDTPTFLLCVAFSAVGGLLPATLLATTPVAAPAARLAPVVMGLVMQGSNLGQAIGPVAVGGAIDRFGWSAAAVITGVASLLGLMLAVLIRSSVKA